MGAKASAALGVAPSELGAVELSAELERACASGDVGRYRELWDSQWVFRKAKQDAQDYEYDKDLMKRGVMDHLRFGFRHHGADWREAGLRAGGTFVYNDEARQQMLKDDFVGALSLSTMTDDAAALADHGKLAAGGGRAGDNQHDAVQVERAHLAATILLSMADYPECQPYLRSYGILNFLGIVLNQDPNAAAIATSVFAKLAGHAENLEYLLDGAVVDLLESYIKVVQYRQPPRGSSLDSWKVGVEALTNCTFTLGTMVKYGYPCQVHTSSVIYILSEFGARTPEELVPDALRLCAELARLLYWLCRTSPDICDKLGEDAPYTQHDPEFPLRTIAGLWAKCLRVQGLLDASGKLCPELCTEDLDVNVRIDAYSSEASCKAMSARRLICYTSCLLWLCLTAPTLRWKFRDLRLTRLDVAFGETDPELKLVMLSTVRHVLDMPAAQQCHDLVKKFGQWLLECLDKELAKWSGVNVDDTRLILDALLILAMQRAMQVFLADQDIYYKLGLLRKKVQDVAQANIAESIELACWFILSEVAMHPRNRLTWMSSTSSKRDNYFGSWAIDALGGSTCQHYPPRDKFAQELEGVAGSKNDKLRTVASLLLVVFQETKFEAAVEDVGKSTLTVVMQWWQVNTTTLYEEQRELAQSGEVNDDVLRQRKPLIDILRVAEQRKAGKAPLTSMEAIRYTAPHECIMILSFLSRLALEPSFKDMFRKLLHPLLGCVCLGIWPEAREAASVLANLMWLPDVGEEHLVCWLKFDGPGCIGVDAANVLMPVRTGEPRPIALGKGMYRSMWGIEFVEGSYVRLHPDGLRTNRIPSLLTSASPFDTFAEDSRKPYEWLRGEPDPKWFSVTCWFYWPAKPTKADKVLVQTTPRPKFPPQQLITLEYVPNAGAAKGGWAWALVDNKQNKWMVSMPPLAQGWHHMALVSSTAEHKESERAYEGTRLYVDGQIWSKKDALKHVWLDNDFCVIGNAAGIHGAKGGAKPFGLIADFRIYARPLTPEEVQGMAEASDTEAHPDALVRQLSEMGAASVLAQRLDVPDCAAECLRALGNMASRSDLRAEIYSICGQQVLGMVSSPYPMIQRMAARLLHNLA